MSKFIIILCVEFGGSVGAGLAPFRVVRRRRARHNSVRRDDRTVAARPCHGHRGRAAARARLYEDASGAAGHRRDLDRILIADVGA